MTGGGGPGHGPGGLPACAGVGPVQAGVEAALRGCPGGPFAAAVAERSPLGPHAVRVRPNAAPAGSEAAACREAAGVLGAQAWVEALAVRPPHVYVRVTARALRAWVTAAGGGLAAGRECDGMRARLRLAGSGPPGSLDRSRERAVGRAVAALLASRGCEVIEDDPGPPGPDRPGRDLRLLVGGPPGQAGPATVHVAVGGVDVPHGPLRARHGGEVSAADLLAELGPGPGAAARLGFVLLRTERASRARLDDGRLRRESEAYDAVLAARRTAAASPRGRAAGPAGERAARELAAGLDLLPATAARAAGALEPSLLARYLRSLAGRVAAAAPHLPPEETLWPAAGAAIDAALSLLGIDAGRPPPEGDDE